MSESCRYCNDNQDTEMCDNCAKAAWDDSVDLLLRSHDTLHEVLGYYVSTNAKEHGTICHLMEDIRDLIGEETVEEYEARKP